MEQPAEMESINSFPATPVSVSVSTRSEVPLSGNLSPLPKTFVLGTAVILKLGCIAVQYKSPPNHICLTLYLPALKRKLPAQPRAPAPVNSGQWCRHGPHREALCRRGKTAPTTKGGGQEDGTPDRAPP